MISRGEVALIVADKGMNLGILPETFVTPILLCVVFTTVITPIFLKMAYKHKADDPDFKESTVSEFEQHEINGILANPMVK